MCLDTLSALALRMCSLFEGPVAAQAHGRVVRAHARALDLWCWALLAELVGSRPHAHVARERGRVLDLDSPAAGQR